MKKLKEEKYVGDEMRKFVVSDLHGDYNTYFSIVAYLENVAKEDEVELYIAGDLIDQGIYSLDILMDVKKRIEGDSPFKVIYLGGNHEWMAVDCYHIMNDDYIYFNDARNDFKIHYRSKREKFDNTYWGQQYFLSDLKYDFEDCLTVEEEENMFNMFKNLKIYQKLEETLNDKPIVIVHAKCPDNPKDICDLTIESICKDVMNTIEKRQYGMFSHLVTAEEQQHYDLICASKVPRINEKNPPKVNLGNENYFTIVGHTIVNNKYGFEYIKSDNVIDIDGGNKLYWRGNFDCDHLPLVKIDSKNNRLIILTFNHNNEIIYGNYFDEKVTHMNDIELNSYKKNLNKKLILKPVPEKDLFE